MPKNPKDILNAVKKKTGKSVTEKDIQKLASGVKPSTVQDEAQLRQLIKQVSQLVGINVPEETVKDIIHAVKSSKLDGNNMQQMMNLIMKK
ncbi:stage VI sporulation protein F [Paenibacillus sp. RC84]|uniref:stage VI sporulation protein F n=1 Tax=Paenibacillus sp. RC84 TaxID=3156252 RepID=UPI003517D4D1